MSRHRGQRAQAKKDLKYLLRHAFITDAEYTHWVAQVDAGHAQQQHRFTSSDLSHLRRVWPLPPA